MVGCCCCCNAIHQGQRLGCITASEKWGWLMGYQKKTNWPGKEAAWAIHHQIDGILLTSSKYDKRQLVMKNVHLASSNYWSQSEKTKYFEWIINIKKIRKALLHPQLRVPCLYIPVEFLKECPVATCWEWGQKKDLQWLEQMIH